MKQQLELTVLLFCIAIVGGIMFLFPEEEKRNTQQTFLEMWWSDHPDLPINTLDSNEIFVMPISSASKRSLWFRRLRNWPFKDLTELCSDPYLSKDSLFFSLGCYSFQPNSEKQGKHHLKNKTSFKRGFNEQRAVSYSSVDLNLADSAALEEIPGIGSGMIRVLKRYRSRYGFVADTSHLRRTTYFGTMWKKEWDSLLRVDSIPSSKLSLASSSFQELLAFPELNFGQVKRLCFYRETFGVPTWFEIASWSEFSKSDTTFLQYYISSN